MQGLVLRYGEIFLKGKNRQDFEKKLKRHVSRLLKDQGEISFGQGRLFIKGIEPTEALLRSFSRLFGIVSLSPVRFVNLTLEAICEGALTALKEAAPTPKRFKISARRSDKRFALNSIQLNTQVGEHLFNATQYPISVKDPEVEVGIEVGAYDAFIFTRTIESGGGLPIGASAPVTLLLSGGIDSPVAGYMAMSRGSTINAVYFHSFPYTGEGAKQKVISLCRRLALYQGHAIALWVVPFTETQEHFRDNASDNLLVILYRRQMIRIAEEIAKKNNSLALVTGESVGQVASQTLENLSVIDHAATMPILRPLCGLDKRYTIKLAEEIDTYNISIQPHDDCCSLFVPKHPKIRADLESILKQESFLPLEDLKKKAVEKAEKLIIDAEE